MDALEDEDEGHPQMVALLEIVHDVPGWNRLGMSLHWRMEQVIVSYRLEAALSVSVVDDRTDMPDPKGFNDPMTLHEGRAKLLRTAVIGLASFVRQRTEAYVSTGWQAQTLASNADITWKADAGQWRLRVSPTGTIGEWRWLVSRHGTTETREGLASSHGQARWRALSALISMKTSRKDGLA